MELHSFTYLKILCLYVCFRVSFFPPREQIQNHQLENVGGLCYCIWHDICYIFYAFICTEHELFVSQSQQHVQSKNDKWHCDLLWYCTWLWQYSGFVLDGVPHEHILTEISVFFIWMKQEASWFLVLNYWHWSFFNCSNIQEVHFFTFILDFKL